MLDYLLKALPIATFPTTPIIGTKKIEEPKWEHIS